MAQPAQTIQPVKPQPQPQPQINPPATPVATPPTQQIQQDAAPPPRSSLYVGDLDKDVSEEQLFSLFSQAGPVHSIRVCRDAVTKRSLGYAYVNFNTSMDPNAAERAIKNLNYTQVGMRPIRIMWSNRDPSMRRSGTGNIFIKNLDKTIDHKSLHDTFSQFGHVLSCKVALDGDGQSKGYGFIHFGDEDAARNAIEQVHGKKLKDKVVYVGLFLKRSERMTDKQKNFTNLYVKNIDGSLSDEQLREVFGQYGAVTSAVIMRHDNGTSKFFGFVNFEDPDAASRACDNLDGKDNGHGKQWYVARAQKKAEREAMLVAQKEQEKQERMQKYQGLNLYIRNLHEQVDDEKLREEFASIGQITSVKVMRNEKGVSRGFGFVCFATPEESAKAVSEMQGQMCMGKPLYVALAQRKDVRRAMLEQQFNRQLAHNRMAPPGNFPPVFPSEYGPPMFFPGGPNALPPAPPQPGMVYGNPVMPRMPREMQQRPGQFRGPVDFNQQGGMMGPGNIRPRGRGRYAPVQGNRGRGFHGHGRGRARQSDKMAQQGHPPQVPMPPQMPGQPPVGQQMGPPAGHMAVQPVPAFNQAPQSAPMVVQPPGQSTMLPPNMPLNTSILAQAEPEQQKQMLGERLFPKVQDYQPNIAGKITGMLLEMDNSELLLLLEDQDLLEEKIQEAIDVLKNHNALPEGVPEKIENRVAAQ